MYFFTKFKAFFSIVYVQLFLLCNFIKCKIKINIEILKVKVLFILCTIVHPVFISYTK